MLDTIQQFIHEGGPFMWVNIGSLSVSVAIIIERIIRLYMTYRLDAGPFMAQIHKAVTGGAVPRALKLCEKFKKVPLARVVRAGLSQAGNGEIEVAKAVEVSIVEETPKIQRRVSSLWSMANIAVLCGLVGTIVGLIGAFKSLGAVSADKKSEILSRGISEAMNNTAFGLGIAVTCIIAHLLLNTRSKAMVEELELSAMKLENLLARPAPAPAPVIEPVSQPQAM